MNTFSHFNQKHTYVPPSWAEDLSHQPSTYVQLASRPTALHPWKLPGVPEGFQVSVKRDDMTGSTLSGNKVRKLEFLLADALQKGCDSTITSGCIQSNHARATAVASRQLGLQPHLILGLKRKEDITTIGCRGNTLLDRAAGTKIITFCQASDDYGDLIESLHKKTEKYKQILEKDGLKPYLIPVGGSSTVGVWGYIEAFRELMDQGLHDQFDDVVVATGSGGTLSGLAIANYLTGSKLKIHGVIVANSVSFFHKFVDQELSNLGLTGNGKLLSSHDVVDIIDGYIGQGYGLNTDEELVQLCKIMCATGVTLDPIYTLKGVRGMLGEMKVNPARFLGPRVLFIHTGGIFGLFDGRMGELLLKYAATNQVFDYKDIIPDI